MSKPDLRALSVCLVASVGLMLMASVPAFAAPTKEQADTIRKSIPKPSAESCAMLDDPKLRGRMDGLLTYLVYGCGREAEFIGTVEQRAEPTAGGSRATDVAVSDPSGDASGTALTQNETSMAYNPTTGTICSGYNDSYHGVTEGNGFSGYSRSTDGGATFTDQGALGPGNGGDPALVWSKRDNAFYYAVLASGGLGIWRSTDDCVSFTNLGSIANSGNDDKELMAVENNDASPNYGRLYVAWTDFSAGGQIFSTYSDNGTTWSTPIQISAGGDVQGAWPVVAPNGDIFVGWVLWQSPGFPNGNVEMQIARSTDGGDTWALVTSPHAGGTNPRNAAATGNCGRPALNGNIRYLPSPQIAVSPNGGLHAIYSYDPDAFNSGDESNVYYRRSTDSGATWQAEIQLNDDGTTTDQFFPSMSVGATGIVTTAWYDRRNDVANNLMIDYYQRTSFDGGATFQPSVRLSDVSTPVALDGNLAACYHGDYDTQIQTETAALIQWADDRGGNSDVFLDTVALSTDFLLLPADSSQSVCAPASATYAINVPQFQGFSEIVNLVANNVPPGGSAGFSVNPVTPPGATVMTITGTAGVNPGSYTIDVVGTSAPSGNMQDTSVGLNVFDAPAAAPTLDSPADDETNVDLDATFTWTAAAQSETFQFQIATDAAFTNVVVDETGVGAASFSPSGLMSNTEYYWRVRAVNPCGDGAWSAVFRFVTLPLPGDCPLGQLPVDLYSEDMESGAPGFTTGGTGSTWALSGTNVNSGSFAYHADNVGVVSDQYLITPQIALPVVGAPLTLQFFNRQEMESSATGCWDGGVLEISTDGTTWTRLESELLTDPYDGPIGSGFDNPLEGENAWCGDPQEWANSIVDIDAWAGQTVQFRFRLATDRSVSRPGWDIDDIRIRNCGDGGLIFEDTFESGGTTAWDRIIVD
ncbi:MAG: choice-of-anchor J domain-containing protein [Acidobacteriota bacterium]